VAHMNAFINDETFDLVEHGRVCLVTIAAICTPRRYDADRRLFIYHCADLHWGCVGTKDFLFAL